MENGEKRPNCNEESFEEEIEDRDSGQKFLLTITSSYGISISVHIIFIIILMYMYLSVPSKKKPPIIISRPPKIEQPFDETLPRALHKTPKIDSPKEVEKPVKDITPDKPESETPKGTDLDNMSTKNLESNSVVDAYGVGGGRSGAYGSRFGKGKWNKHGGSSGSESAVLAALLWLKLHQTQEGYWKSYDYDSECKKTIRCKNNIHGPREDESKNSEYYRLGRGFNGFDVGVTSLAVLAFLGNGHTHQFGKFKRTVRKAIEWLKGIQINDPSSKWHGSLGYIVKGKTVDHAEWIYNHAISTMALCEAYAITKDFALKDYAQRAVDFAAKCQNPGLGWSHHASGDDPSKVIKPGVNDSAVTGWMVLALKSAKNAGSISDGGLNIPKHYFNWAIKWFDSVTNTTGAMGYMTPSGASGVFPGRQNFYEAVPTMTAVGVLCRLFSGQSRQNEVIKKGVQIIMRKMPKWEISSHRTTNMYFWYYGTYAMFQVGGKNWHCGKSYSLKKLKSLKCICWNHSAQKALLLNQRQGVRGDCADGSWDPIGEWGIAGGRVYSTSIGAITLEVFYRYDRMRK